MKYCFDIRHGTPCPLPCIACEAECNPRDYEDNEVNRRRDAEWEARKLKEEEK